MTIYNQIKQEEIKRDTVFIENIDFLCDHGGLHPIKARKRKYIPENVYNQMLLLLFSVHQLVQCDQIMRW